MADTTKPVDASSVCGDTTSGNGATAALTKLPDAQVFSRDAEDYTQEAIADTVARLSKIITRQRLARKDDAEIAEATLKIKKANKAAATKKAKAANILESKV